MIKLMKAAKTPGTGRANRRLDGLVYRIRTGKWIWAIAKYAILVLLAYQLLYPQPHDRPGLRHIGCDVLCAGRVWVCQV